MRATAARPLLTTCLATCLAACADDDPPPDPEPAPAHCVQPEDRLDRIVQVSGAITDFTTGQAVPGATVDITTAWDTEGAIPAADCPLLATVTTDERGRFGPLRVYAGTGLRLPIMLFRVAGGGRAVTLSDNRACTSGEDGTCHLEHAIAAPSAALAAQWRADLASGGMTDADRRGLIAFLYKNSDGTPADGVQPILDYIFPIPRPGVEVRFVDAARAGLTPPTDAATGVAGVALAGIEPFGTIQGTVDVGGMRGADRWAYTGSLIVPGAIFVEDRTVTPPQ